MPTMPERPSKKAQKIAEDLNPLVVKPKNKKNKMSLIQQRDMVVNRRYPELNP